jgi:hypothetical protein
MPNTNPKFLGMDFQPVDLTDLNGSIKSWCDERRNTLTGLRFFVLIQERTTGDYEVIKNNKSWPLLRKVALGYVSTHLKRKYGQSDVAANINVWIATDEHKYWKEELENFLLGRWINKEAEAVRARKCGEFIMKYPDIKPAFWEERAPEAYAWLKANNYVTIPTKE